ncbi:MAG TPA: S1C family serine protease [Gemmatimonadaceae bacterium]|nr:S1C family serine protease [Gemmatimonadaceae bacterium]
MRVPASFLIAAIILPTAGLAQPVTARAIAARANQAVVAITATMPNGDRATGTGFFVKANGTFITNYHVVEGASSLTVELPTREIFRTIYFLGADSDHDLAILRVPVASPGVLDLGSDAALEVGDALYAMSNPLGLDRTFSEGILSSKRLERGVQLLQITVPISHGSSGGPIMDGSGKVVGVATLVTRQGQALNWAVPVRYVAPLLELAGSPRIFSLALVPNRPGLIDDESATPAQTTEGTAAAGSTAADLDAAMRLGINRMVAAISAQYPIKLTHDIGTGSLRAHQTRIMPVTLDEGVTYKVIGTCDRDCTDLDLELRLLDGTVVSSDVKTDDYPMVTVTPSRGGKFNIVVSMAACSVEPCWFGVGVVTKR